MKYLIALLLCCSTLMAKPPIGYNDPTIGGLVGWWTMNDAPGYSYAGPYDSLAGWWKLDLDYGGPVNGTNDGLVAWYKMDEGTGTLTTADSSGNGNTGYLTNSPAWTNGVVGSALKFNGTSQFIYIPTNSVFTIVTNLTVSSWCNWFGGSSENCIVDRAYGYATTILGSSGGNIKIYYQRDGSWVTSVAIPQNKWINISWTLTASSLNLYTNGILAASTTPSGGVSSLLNNVVAIGSIGAGGWYFNGSIDDVRIYNRALSASEITAIYQAEAGIYAIDSSTNNNLTVVNDGIYTNGAVGGGLAFSLSPNPAKASISAALDITNGSITLCAWCYPTNLQSYNRIVLKRNGDTAPESYSLGLHNGKVSFENSSTNGYNQYNSIPTISSNTFSHVAITYTWGNSASTTTYINGVAVSGTYDIGNGTSTSSDASPTYPVTIGGESNSFYGFGGVLDDVRIYNRALTANEIANIYRAKFGNYTVDSSGNNNLTVVNDGVYTNGVVGGGLAFSLSPNPAKASISAALDITNGSITLCAWCYPTNLQSYNRIVLKRNGDTAPESYSLGLHNGKVSFENSSTNGYNQYNSIPTISSNTFSHVAITYTWGNSASTTTYINGVAVSGTYDIGNGTSTSSDASPTYPVTIGGESNSFYGFGGVLDDVRIYNRALSSDEILKLYNGGYGSQK
jgi:hypothetical protein